MDDVDSENEDEDDKPAARPYMALLQSFSETSAPKAKRRKIEHDEPAASKIEQDESGEESDEGSKEEESDQDIDQADEADDDAAAEADEQFEDDDDDSEDEGDYVDPFDTHFAHAKEDLVAKRVKAMQADDWATKRALVQSLRATIMYPNSDAGPEPPKPVSGLDSLKLKQKLKEIASRKIGDFTKSQQNLGSLLFNYRDVLHCDRSAKNADKLRQLTCLHALNHVFK